MPLNWSKLELKHKYEFKILESTKAFNTIVNFPNGKPIYAEPKGFEQVSDLKINEGVKESLLMVFVMIGKQLP